MSDVCIKPMETLKGLMDTLQKKYPVFISHILNGVTFESPCFEYACSTVRDVDELVHILRGLEVRLDSITIHFPQWESIRKDTMDHLIMYADEVDIHRKNSNIAILSGSVAGVVGGGLGILGLLTAVPTGGASLALVGAGGVVSAGASIAYVGINKYTKDRVVEHVKRDEELTRKLAKDLEHLDQFIGRLGRWINIAPVQSTQKPLINADSAKCLTTMAASGMKWQSSATGASKCTKDAVETGSMVLRNSAAIMIGVGMLLDVALIAYVSHDIHTGSKTATGNQLRRTAEKLDKELQEVRKIYLKIQCEGERQQDRRTIKEQRILLADKDSEIEQLRARLAALDA